MRRDPKGLYSKAQAGQIKNFTGFDAPCEEPEGSEVHLHTLGYTPSQLADEVLAVLVRREIIVAIPGASGPIRGQPVRTRGPLTWARNKFAGPSSLTDERLAGSRFVSDTLPALHHRLAASN